MASPKAVTSGTLQISKVENAESNGQLLRTAEAVVTVPTYSGFY